MDIQDKIRNEYIREKVVVVVPNKQKMVEFSLKWFSHVRRRPIKAPIRKVDQMEESLIVTGRGRSRKNLGEPIKKDFDLNDLSEDFDFDRTQLHRLVYVVDPD